MSIDNITRNNTVDEWRIQTNQSANALNHIETIDYNKSNGVFTFSGPTTTLSITASGTPLQVTNKALFQTNVEIGQSITLGNESTKKGNLLVGNTVSIYGEGTALYVANNVNVGSNVFVVNSMNTRNVIVRTDATVSNSMVVIANVTGGNFTTANATQTGNLRVISDATVGTSLTVGTTLVVTGNTTGGNLTTANATQTGNLRVISDATVGTSLTVGTTLVVTGNTTGGDLTTANATQTGNLRVTSDATIGTTLTVGTTLTTTGNVSGGNLTTANATQTGNLRVISDATVGTTLVVTGNTTGGNLTTANATQTGNLRVASDATVGTTLTVTGNTTGGNLTTANATQTGTLRVGTEATVGTTLTVTGNTTGGNLTTANATQTGTLRVGTEATVGTTLTVTGNTTVGNLHTANAISAGVIRVSGGGTSSLGAVTMGNLIVQGSFTLTGNTILDSDRITLRANTPTTIGVDRSFIEIRRQNTGGDIGTTANANAQIRWNEPAKYFDIRNVDNPDFYEKILTSNLITDSITTTNSSLIASATAIKTTNDNITANVLNSGAAVVVAQNFATAIDDTDPGNGNFKFNNATIASATFAYMDNLDAYGATITGILSAYSDSTNTVKGHLRFSVFGASTTKFAVFAITTPWSTPASGYYKVGLTYVSGAGTFTNGDLVMVQYSRAGNVGAQGVQGFNGTQGAQGVQGVVGAQGVQGVIGAQGVQGVIGVQGVQGVIGVQGVQGAPGAQGVQGFNGTQGAQGVQGAPGVQGATGGFSTNSNGQVNSLGVGTAGSGTAGEIRATADITAYYSSDRRLKENIRNIKDPLNKVKQLNGVYYDWTDEHIKSRGGEDGYFMRKRDIGMIAQEVEKILPEIVADREDGYKAIKYERVVAVLVEAVKELYEKVEVIETKIKDK